MMVVLAAVVIFRSTRMTMKWRKKKQQKKNKAAYSNNEIPMTQGTEDMYDFFSHLKKNFFTLEFFLTLK